MKTSKEPPIVVLKSNFKLLRPLTSNPHSSSIADYLANELDRARIVESELDAPEVIRLGSRVRFTDSTNSKIREYMLVMPGEANISTGRISILTPVGAALLGLSVGQEITFMLPKGHERSLQVLDVINDNNAV